MHIYMCLYDHDLFITKNVAMSFVDELLMLFKEWFCDFDRRWDTFAYIFIFGKISHRFTRDL